MNRLAELTLQYCVDAIGVMEDPIGSNSGRAVDLYLSSVGLKSGNPWCAAFVYYHVMKACETLGLDVKQRYPRTGSCAAVQRWATPNRKITSPPMPGDAFLKLDAHGVAHHMGLVRRVYSDGTFQSIEGNSNDNGLREGVGVYSLRRHPQGLLFVFIG